ncbi:malonyl-CoA:anthocyanidin O-glucoside-6''-O-malonyltransferase [Salix suchowensis]|nr:malonyl-CoA:anthocyanidin O-glucoside-6''-O-malonyltransferase [Salix suchowensis]
MASTHQAQVKILEVCQVTPSLNSLDSATELSFPLTFFDILFLKVTPAERLFFYKLTEPHRVILTRTKFIILYALNDGVPLTIAQSDADFDHLSGTDVCEITDISFTLQITLFPNQGISIGATVHHGVFDAKNVAMFIRAWAHVNKQFSENENADQITLLPELTPFLARTIIEDPDGIDMLYLNSWLGLVTETKSISLDTNHNTSLKLFKQAITDPHSKVRALVRLTLEDIKNLRERVLCQIEELHLDKETRPMHLSSFVLAYAYVFVCIFKAKGLGRDDKVVLGLTADCRARLGIPENYFGCCVMPFFVHMDPETVVQENGFLNVIERLSGIIARVNKGVLDGTKEKFAEFMAIRPGTLMVTVSGSPQFQIYKADFGWGMPRKVETPSIDKTGSISMQENADGRGGIEIGLVLLKHEMEIFRSLFVEGL